MQRFLNQFFLLIVLCISLTSCQVYNSSSQDSIKYSTLSYSTILQNKCTPCHNFYAQSSTDLINSGLLVPGDPSNSPLFSRIIGSGVGGSEDMPPSSSSSGTLSDSEIKIIQDWISAL